MKTHTPEQEFLSIVKNCDSHFAVSVIYCKVMWLHKAYVEKEEVKHIGKISFDMADSTEVKQLRLAIELIYTDLIDSNDPTTKL